MPKLRCEWVVKLEAWRKSHGRPPAPASASRSAARLALQRGAQEWLDQAGSMAAGSKQGRMNRKLEIGSVLSEVFSIYGSQAGVLLPIAFWLFLLVAVVNGLIAGSLIMLAVALAVSTIASTLYQGTVVELVSDVQDGRRDSSVGDLLRSATPFILPLIGAGILAGLGIGIGLILLVVPGLFLATIWAVIAPVIVVERKGVFDAFGRSHELVRGNGWPVLGVIVITFVIVFVGSVVFGAIGEAISNGPLVRIVFSAIASTITAPVGALVASVLYFRLLAIDPAPALTEPPSAGLEQPGDRLG
jgi:hypothetical protein